MPRGNPDTVTVSPPTLDRTAFRQVDAALGASHSPYARDWLMARFQEGLEIRLLCAPRLGLVAFQPGRLAWRAIDGAAKAVVVQDLRVAAGPQAATAKEKLWSAVDRFAQYYGYDMVLGIIGKDHGLIDPAFAPPRGYVTLDDDGTGSQLVGRILQGPVSLPRLPRDWARRATLAGRGIVIQSSGESAALEAKAADLARILTKTGIAFRRERFTDGATARARSCSPGGLFCVLKDGLRVAGAESELSDIVARLAAPGV